MSELNDDEQTLFAALEALSVVAVRLLPDIGRLIMVVDKTGAASMMSNLKNKDLLKILRDSADSIEKQLQEEDNGE